MGDVEYHTLIKEMPEGERPRERLELYGEAALSNAELIAIALRTGSRTENAVGLAQRLLTAFQGLAGLAQASVRELCEVSGIGPAKAAQLKAALELGRRLILSSGDSRPQITCPADAANLFLAAMSIEAQEQLRVMLLDSRHRVQRMSVVYVGNVNTSMIRVAEVFRQAIKDNSSAIVVAHNHPSGDPTPSPEDVRVTEQMVRAGKMLDIEVLDHLIIGKQRYVSLKERGLGFR
ncbi:MAG TPA: DNA repair protein RadC [Anaerolineae bacterium]|nr:DNA repair protein RadC [Anaerolineae bacterium]